MLHDTISGCKTYSPTTQNECSVCVAGTTLFTKSTKCTPVLEITGCATYSDTTTCTSCLDNYDFVDNICLPILPTDNCLRKIGGVC